MSQTLRNQILAAADLPLETVAVPEWPCGKVLMRGLSGTDRDAWEISLWEGQGGERRFVSANMRARLVVRCVVDEAGERVFSDADAEPLGQKSGAVLDRLYDVARRLSGMQDHAVETAAKN